MDTRRKSFGQRGSGQSRSGQRRASGQSRSSPVLAVTVAALGIAAVSAYALQESGLGQWFEAAPVSSVTYTERQFPVCGGGARVTCVVDGDTFWLDGVKIRIADIDTPEIGSPQCASEAALGRQATSRLTQLLNAGPISLESVDRDEDRYGRKLRIVTRDGQSLGAVLVAEGLAHEWGGTQRGWC